MPATAGFAAVILAGGRATRLGGADKPGLTVGGRTLLATAIAAAQEAGTGQVIVVGPERDGLPIATARATVRFVREEPPGAGPLAALRRGLAELPGRGADRVAVLAADLPFVRASHLGTLLAALDGPQGPGDLEGPPRRNGAVLIDAQGYPQWLTGCWRTAVLADAAATYTGFSLRGLMAPLEPARVLIQPGPGEPPPWLDCDTDADLRRARAWPAAPAGDR